MTKVFIGGSRRVSRLPVDVQRRIDRIIEKNLQVLIGDANGSDKTVQRYLHERGYGHVEVFCSDETPRNNLGSWPLRVIRPDHLARDFDYYATKDRAMAGEASIGLMMWDGESRGTLLNVVRLFALHKTVVVYVGPRKTFFEVRSRKDLDRLTMNLDSAAARKLRDQAASEGLVELVDRQPTLRL